MFYILATTLNKPRNFSLKLLNWETDSLIYHDTANYFKTAKEAVRFVEAHYDIEYSIDEVAYSPKDGFKFQVLEHFDPLL